MLGVEHLTAVAKELCGPNASQALLEAFPLDVEGITAFNAGVIRSHRSRKVASSMPQGIPGR